MTASFVVISLVPQQSLEETSLAERDDMVGAFSTDRSHDALRVWVLPGRNPGTDHFLDANYRELFAELPTVDRVPVAVRGISAQCRRRERPQ